MVSLDARVYLYVHFELKEGHSEQEETARATRYRLKLTLRTPVHEFPPVGVGAGVSDGGERKLAPAGAGLTRRKRRSQCMWLAAIQ